MESKRQAASVEVENDKREAKAQAASVEVGTINGKQKRKQRVLK